MNEGDRHKTGSATTTCWQVQSEGCCMRGRDIAAKSCETDAQART